MYAILGATGKVGRATIRMLRATGQPVRAIVRDEARGAELAAAGCELAVAHLGDPEALRKAFAGASAVQIICPVMARADHALEEMRAMVDAAAEALAAVGARSVLAISDYGAELPEGSGVTLAFHHLEQRLGMLDAELTFLRSAEHMQNWSRHLRVAASTGVLPSMHHPITKPFPTVSASDVGVIAAALLTEPRDAGRPRVVHVEGPRRYTTAEVAAALTSVVGREVVARELPRAEWLAALAAGGLGASYAELVIALYDTHNAGRIDAEAGVGEIRRGTGELRDVLNSLPRPKALRSEPHV